MAKRLDNDATMEVSTSQLVVDPPALKPNAPKLPPPSKNDASMWAYRVVGTDDFAPAPAAPARTRRWLIVLLVLAAFGAGAFYALKFVR
jgi:hypothetical protein